MIEFKNIIKQKLNQVEYKVKMLKAKYISLIVVLLISVPYNLKFTNAVAQENDNNELKKAELMTVDSKPMGAIIQLEGLYNFIGRTPYVLPYPVHGRYKIRASKEGYESVTANMNFVGKGENYLLIKLKPKTRFKAASRSLIFPGWGQIYGGSKFRGVIISAIQIALGIRTIIAINDYNNENDNLDRALENFNRNMSEVTFQGVQDRLQKADEAYNFRNTMLIITASFWAYNVLDSIFFFSPRSTQLEIKTNQFTQNFLDNSLMLSWKIGL